MTEEEFKRFFNRHFDGLRNYLYYRSGEKELASDIAQDTFIKLWEKQIKDEGKRTVGLAYKIANDLFLNKIKRSALEVNYLNSLEFEFTNTTPEKEMQYKELKEKYELTLANLGEKQRVVFLMSRLDGLKYAEIAERLGISVKAVEKRMKGALGTFRTALTALVFLLYLSNMAETIFSFMNNSKSNV